MTGPRRRRRARRRRGAPPVRRPAGDARPAGDGPADGCRADDAEAELCRRYARRLVAFGRSRLGSEDAAHDLAQDTLLLTLEKLRAGERVRGDRFLS